MIQSIIYTDDEWKVLSCELTTHTYLAFFGPPKWSQIVEKQGRKVNEILPTQSDDVGSKNLAKDNLSHDVDSKNLSLNKGKFEKSYKQVLINNS